MVEGSISGVLTERHYNRGVRVHKLVMEPYTGFSSRSLENGVMTMTSKLTLSRSGNI